MKTLASIMAFILIAGTSAFAQTTADIPDADDQVIAPTAGQIQAEQPSRRGDPDIIRVMPVAGAAAFQRENTADVDNIDEGFTAGLLVNFGNGPFALETGILNVETEQTFRQAIDNIGGQGDLDYWAVPVVGKWNISGNPNSTIFLKAGAHVLSANTETTDTFDDIDLIGVAGVGGAIPLWTDEVALVLDASYNSLFTREGITTPLSGYTFTAGLSMNL